MDIKDMLKKIKTKEPKQDTPINEVNENDTDVIVVEEEKGGIVNTIVNAVLIVAIAVAIICTYVSFVSTSGNGVPSILGIRPFSIQTESMYPTLKPGDLIIDTAVKDTSELEVGDIITYWTIINGERVLNTHRISAIYDGGGYLIFATRGDNNSVEDALTVHESEIVGQFKMRIGGLGKIFDYLQTSTGFLIVVVVPVLIFFIYHLIQFFRVLFEYQNLKNKLLYEQERGATEDLIEEEKRRQEKEKQKQKNEIEQKLREQLKAELLREEWQKAGKTEEEILVLEQQRKEQARKAEEERLRLEAEKAALIEAEKARLVKEEEEKLLREKLKAELLREEAERKAKEEAERKAAEEERLRLEAEKAALIEAEKARLAKEEEERLLREKLKEELLREEAERKAKEEQERILLEQQKAKEEQERLLREELKAELLREEQAKAAKEEQERKLREELKAELLREEQEKAAKEEQEKLLREKLKAELLEEMRREQAAKAADTFEEV